MPVVIALNRFGTDTSDELSYVQSWAQEKQYPIALSEVFEKGGLGGIDLAKLVLNAVDKNLGAFEPLVDASLSVKEKIVKICKEIYGADNVEFSSQAKVQLNNIKKNGWDKLPICMAKTQYSLSDNPKLLGKPTGFTISIRDLKPSIGAGFIVALCGDIMTMPGLPKEPAANNMDVVEGKTIGLF